MTEGPRKMEEILTEISKVHGTRGVFLLGPKGEVVAQAPREGHDIESLELILHEMQLTLASLRIYDAEVEEIDFVFENTRVFARKLARSAFVVFCEPKVDIAMLRMTINVNVAYIKEEADMYPYLSRKWYGQELTGREPQEIYKTLSTLGPGEVDHA